MVRNDQRLSRGKSMQAFLYEQISFRKGFHLMSASFVSTTGLVKHNSEPRPKGNLKGKYLAEFSLISGLEQPKGIEQNSGQSTYAYYRSAGHVSLPKPTCTPMKNFFRKFDHSRKAISVYVTHSHVNMKEIFSAAEEQFNIVCTQHD